jgi:hypothetical protein
MKESDVMLKINGNFKIWDVKKINENCSVLNLSNSDKDNEGNYTNSYFKIFLNKNTPETGLTKEFIMNKEFVMIEGYLQIKPYCDKFTGKIKGYNNVIYPKMVKKFEKNNYIADEMSVEDILPF